MMGRFGLIEQQMPIAFGLEDNGRDDSGGRSRLRSRRVHPMMIVLVVLVALISTAALGVAGWELRQMVWRQSPTLRSEAHVARSFDQGLAVFREAKLAIGQPADALGAVPWIELPRGLYSYYGRIPADRAERAQHLHTPPLRVAVMAAWVNWLRGIDPAAERYDPGMSTSLLAIASGVEGSAAVLAMLIVMTWTLRSPQLKQRLNDDGAAVPAAVWPKALLLGVIAAGLVWLNPAMLLSGHVAGAFDAWLVPLVLLVVLLASTGAWLAAGAAMVLACVMQGNAVYFAPLLVLWPLASGRFADALRSLTGMVAMAALLASAWLVPSPRAWIWVGVMVMFAAAVAPWVYPRRLGFAWWVAAVFALCVLVASVTFDSSWPWTRALEHMVQSRPEQMHHGPANNLPALLGTTYGWSPRDVIGTISPPWLGTRFITLESLMIASLLAVVVACAVGAAVHTRRRDPHVLAAMIAPWLAIFVLLPGMHERWLLWAAVISAIGLAASVGLTLLHVLISGLATMMILHRLLLSHPDYMPGVLRVLQGTHPGLAWAMLLCLGMMLFISLAPRRPRPHAQQ
jgi:hypothetical protein